MEDEEKAKRLVCMCKPPHSLVLIRFEDRITNRNPKPHHPESCDDGKTCLCWQPAAEHPDHPWKLSYAGLRKFRDQLIHLDLRDAFLFRMLYRYRFYAGYTVLEILQNLLLDFDEVGYDCHKRWAICEALACFLHDPASGDLLDICE